MDLDAQIAELEAQVAESEALQNQGGEQQQQQQGQQQQPQQPARFAKDSDDRSIFVGNLPTDPNLSPEEVAEFFSECGPINNCTLLKDRNTGALKGTAYVEFGTFEAVGRALDAKQNAVFRGQTLTINKKHSRFDPSRARGRGGRGGRGAGGNQDPMQMMAAMMGMMQQAMGGRGGRGGGRGRGGRGGGRGGNRGGFNRGGGGAFGNQNQQQGGPQGGAGGFQPFQ